MGKRKKVENQTTSVETIPMEQVETEQKNSTRYVVVKDGFRVSDKEYNDPQDPVCVNELEFWKRVSTNFSHGEKVEVVIYDSKKHRIW